jgi:tetratricopeptide (TPR) repeat protein
MKKQSETFGRLLKAGLNSIAMIEGKTSPLIDEEIGALVSLAGTSIQRYRSGFIPGDHDFARVVAEACIARGLLGQRWLEPFLKAANYPPFEAQALIARLFPAASAPARVTPTRPNLPPPTFSRFIMRRDAYDAALAGLASDLPLTAIVSLGGMGKTSLARVLAGDCLEGRASRSFDAVVWVSDQDRPGTTSRSTLLDAVARALGYPGFLGLPAAEKQRAVEDLLRAQPVLLVLDNAETVEDMAALEWLAQLPAPSKALLTSRTAPPARLPACLVDLEPMDAGEARALIADHIQHTRLRQLPDARAQLQPLAVAAGGNPKAITMALGLVQRRPLDEVLAGLRGADLDTLFAGLFARAWALLDAASAHTLLALTLFAGSAAEAALAFCADLSPAAFAQVADRLADLSLLDLMRTDLHAPPRYALHPLVRAFAAARLAERPDEETTLRGRWLTWCADLAESVGFCWANLDRLDILDPELDTLQAALEWAAAHSRDQATVRLAEGLRYYTNVHGLWDAERLKNYRRRADAALRLGDTSEAVLALAQRAEVLSKKDTLAEAAAWLAEAEAVAAGAALSTDADFELGHARGTLAYAQGDLPAAEGHWRALLPFAATLDAQKHVIARRWLATSLLEQGQVDEAVALYRASLADARAANDTRSVTGNTLKLAAIDLGRGDLAAAEAALAECYAAATRYIDRRRLAECHRLIARLRVAQGDSAAAAESLALAIDQFTRMGMRKDAAAAQAELAVLQGV